MTRPARPRFDPKVLRALAGPAAFGRGEVYHAEGRATLLAVARKRTLIALLP